MATKQAFAERLKCLREGKGLSQEGLSKILEISRASIGYYESAQRVPDIEILAKMAEFFGVSCDYLIGKDEHEIPSVNDISKITGLSKGAVAWLAFNSEAEPGRLKALNRLFENGLISVLLSTIERHLVTKDARIFMYDTINGNPMALPAMSTKGEDEHIKEYIAQSSFIAVLRALLDEWPDGGAEIASTPRSEKTSQEHGKAARKKLGL